MTGSGDNLTVFANVVVVQNQEQAYTPSHTHMLRSILGDNFKRDIKLHVNTVCCLSDLYDT